MGPGWTGNSWNDPYALGTIQPGQTVYFSVGAWGHDSGVSIRATGQANGAQEFAWDLGADLKTIWVD